MRQTVKTRTISMHSEEIDRLSYVTSFFIPILFLMTAAGSGYTGFSLVKNYNITAFNMNPPPSKKLPSEENTLEKMVGQSSGDEMFTDPSVVSNPHPYPRMLPETTGEEVKETLKLDESLANNSVEPDPIPSPELDQLELDNLAQITPENQDTVPASLDENTQENLSERPTEISDIDHNLTAIQKPINDSYAPHNPQEENIPEIPSEPLKTAPELPLVNNYLSPEKFNPSSVDETVPPPPEIVEQTIPEVSPVIAPDPLPNPPETGENNSPDLTTKSAQDIPIDEIKTTPKHLIMPETGINNLPEVSENQIKNPMQE